MCLNEPYYKKIEADVIYEILKELEQTVLKPTTSHCLVTNAEGAKQSWVAFTIALLNVQGPVTNKTAEAIKAKAEDMEWKSGLYKVSTFGIEYIGRA
jgi:hypothetical protein